MRLLPEIYDNLDIQREEKIFINKLKSILSDKNIMFLNIKTMIESINNIIIFEDGFVFIENIAVDTPKNLQLLLDMIYINQHDRKMQKLKCKLQNNRYFSKKKSFVDSLNYKYFLTKLKRKETLDSVTHSYIEFIEKHCIFQDDIYNAFESESSIKDILLDKKIELEKQFIECFMIIFTPEYTIPIYNESLENNNDIIPINIEGEKIKKDDLSTKILRLDNDQINIVNSINRGNRLMLACAGSGKSVLLISKCFKIASLYEQKEKKFLLTCYNKNLNEMYNWRINISGFRERNVDCFTFHKLCMILLDEVGISYEFDEEDESTFDNLFNLVRQKLDDGTIKRRYYGIFMDEVQVFRPEWYKLCYDLLEDKNDNNHFFIVCGDKSQDVSKNTNKSKNVWQQTGYLPNLDIDTIRLETNYRNTIEINNYVNTITENAKSYARKYNFEFLNDKDYILRGNAVKHGEKPTIINTNRMNEAEYVLKEVKRLNNKGIELHDIAILFVNKKHEVFNYYIYSWIKKKLDDDYIDYSELSPNRGENRVSYGYRQGVTLCTVNSALGLDFKAVILCGLYPLGLYNNSYKEERLKKASDQVIQDYIQNINIIYTGCTRARDELSIILASKDDNSIYKKILQV